MNLQVKIKDIMSSNVVFLERNATFSEAKKLLKKYQIHHLLIIENDELLGVISNNDILNAALNQPDNLDTLTMRDIMETEVVSIKEDATVIDAAKFFSNGQMHSLPVTDQSNLVKGIITTHDIIRHLADIK